MFSTWAKALLQTGQTVPVRFLFFIALVISFGSPCVSLAGDFVAVSNPDAPVLRSVFFVLAIGCCLVVIRMLNEERRSIDLEFSDVLFTENMDVDFYTKSRIKT